MSIDTVNARGKTSSSSVTNGYPLVKQQSFSGMMEICRNGGVGSSISVTTASPVIWTGGAVSQYTVSKSLSLGPSR